MVKVLKQGEEHFRSFINSENKLTNWYNEPTVFKLQEDLDSVSEYYNKVTNRIKKWNDIRDIKNAFKPPYVENKSKVQPKLVRKQNEWRYSNLIEPFQETTNLFTVNPRAWDDKDAAVQTEQVLNYQFDTKIDRIHFFDEYIRTCVDDGTAIIKISWDRQSHIEKETVPVFEYYEINPLLEEDQDNLNILKNALNLYQQSEELFNEELPLEIQESVLQSIDKNTYIIASHINDEEIDIEVVDENKPVLTILDPLDFYIDPTCNGNVNNAKFIIQRFVTSKVELEQAGIYKNLNKVNFSDNMVVLSSEQGRKEPVNFQYADSARKKVFAYEYWGYYDVDGDGKNLTCILATWIGDTIIRMQESPYPDGKPPYVVVPYLPIHKEVYGEADAELLEENQQIIGAVTRGCIDLLGNSANSQIGIAEGFLDPVQRRRFEEGNNYSYNPSFTPEGSVYQHKYPEISNSALAIIQMQSIEAESITGIKSFSQGMDSNAYGGVATGMRGVMSAAGVREMNILRRLANGIRQIGEKIIALNSVFLSEQDVVRITSEKFIRINPDNLKGNFDIKVEISSIDSDNAKAQDLVFMLQTLGNTVDKSVTDSILIEYARLKKLPWLQHQIANQPEPQPDPVQLKLQELQIAKIQAEIDKINSESMYNLAKINNTSPEEIESKIQLNQAKARQALSQADKLDLDYVEQESGTKHLRDIDRITSQAESNQNAKVTDAILKDRLNNKKPIDINNPLGISNSENNIPAAIGYNKISKQMNVDSPLNYLKQNDLNNNQVNNNTNNQNSNITATLANTIGNQKSSMAGSPGYIKKLNL